MKLALRGLLLFVSAFALVILFVIFVGTLKSAMPFFGPTGYEAAATYSMLGALALGLAIVLVIAAVEIRRDEVEDQSSTVDRF